MRDRLVLLFLLLPALVISIGARRAEPMYTPPPIEVPKGAMAGDLSKAIQAALTGRGWSVDQENVSETGGASEILSTLSVRVHTVTIRIEFDDERVQIHYVASTNMRYEEDKDEKYIHPKYTQWLKNLELELKSEVHKLSR